MMILASGREQTILGPVDCAARFVFWNPARTFGDSMKSAKKQNDETAKSFGAAVKAMGKPEPRVGKPVKKLAKSLAKADKDVPPKIKK